MHTNTTQESNGCELLEKWSVLVNRYYSTDIVWKTFLPLPKCERMHGSVKNSNCIFYFSDRIFSLKWSRSSKNYKKLWTKQQILCEFSLVLLPKVENLFLYMNPSENQTSVICMQTRGFFVSFLLTDKDWWLADYPSGCGHCPIHLHVCLYYIFLELWAILLRSTAYSPI